MAFNSSLFGKVAIGKFLQFKSVLEELIEPIDIRLTLLESYKLQERLIEAEDNILTLQNALTLLTNRVSTLEPKVTTLQSHKHNYDVGGVAEVTGLPRQ